MFSDWMNESDYSTAVSTASAEMWGGVIAIYFKILYTNQCKVEP